MAIREASDVEKAYLRTDGQHSRLYLAFPQPAIVFKALVNNASINNDMIASIEYDTIDVPGSWANILPDMTLLVGSEEEGCDLGIARIRKDGVAEVPATDTLLYIGETSEVKFADDMHLTVIDEYGLWPRHKYVQSGDEHIDYMDRNVVYTDQHELLDPVPVLGPDRVLFYKGVLAAHPGNSVSTQMDASESYCLSSSGAKTYAWTAATGTIDNASVANPTIHFHTPGTHRVSCEVTIGGKSFTGRRVTVVYDDTSLPVSDFKLASCRGDYQGGGWDFKVTMYGHADLDLVRDRAQVILFARDWYGDVTSHLTSAAISFEASSHKIKKSSGLDIFLAGSTIQVSGSAHNRGTFTVLSGSGSSYLVVAESLVDESAGASVTIQILNGHTELSIGQIPGCENIIASGWIDKEDLKLDIDGGTASFTAHGPNYWLNQMEGFISGLRHSETAPTEWNYVLDLTVDKGLWDLLHWRSTATVVIDVKLTGSTQLIPTMESVSVGSLWEQITGQAYSTMLATACCDRYGRLFIEVNGQYVPLGERNFINVMTIEAYDRIGEIEVERSTVDPTSTIDLSGVWFDGVTGYAVRALAHGHVMGRYGRTEGIDKIIVADQDHCNELAARILAQRNNEYPDLRIELACNMRLVDVCPQQQLFVVTDTDMNPREITISNNIFVRGMTIAFNDKAKSISIEVDGEPETVEVVNVVTGDIPIIVEPPDDIPPIEYPIPIFPPIIPIIVTPPPPPPPPPPPSEDCLDDSPANGPFFANWDRPWIDGSFTTPGTHSTYLWHTSTLRSGAAVNRTVLIFNIINRGNSYSHVHLYGIDASGTRVAVGNLSVLSINGNVYTMEGTFAQSAATSIAGYELVMDAGGDSEGPPIIQEESGAEATPYGYGSSHCEITHQELYFPGTNQLLFYWGADTYGAGIWWYYAAFPYVSGNLKLQPGLSSKFLCHIQISAGGGIGSAGPLIPVGPGYGASLCQWDYFGLIYFTGIVAGDPDPVNSWGGTWHAGCAQTALPNPSVRDVTVHQEGALQIIAASVIVPWSAGLGPVNIYNVCV